MAQTPLRPQKSAVLIAQRIVADIHRHGRAAGDRLPPERVMLDQYAVGRGTLRESLRFLELQGIISLKPGPKGGPVIEQPDVSGFVTSLTLLLQFENAPYRTVLEARMGLEPMMASLAATRMSKDELDALRVSVEEMKEGIKDPAVFAETNRRFHNIIAWGSGNVLFGYLIDALLGIIERTVMGIDYPQRRSSLVIEAHSSIYEALASGDEATSMTAMQSHFSEYIGYAEKKFPEVLDRTVTWETP
jgi:GntR family transcriptional regulator, transcriptional repressor for pyruvate dehydrogenase complex